MRVLQQAPNGEWVEVKLNQHEQRASQIWGTTATTGVVAQLSDSSLSLDMQHRWESAWCIWHGGDNADGALDYGPRRLNTEPGCISAMGLVNGLGMTRHISSKGAWIGRCRQCHQVTIWTGVCDTTRMGAIPRYCKDCGPEVRRRQARDSARRQRSTDLSERLCPVCSVSFTPKRTDARCCSGKCRAKLSRQEAKAAVDQPCA